MRWGRYDVKSCARSWRTGLMERERHRMLIRSASRKRVADADNDGTIAEIVQILLPLDRRRGVTYDSAVAVKFGLRCGER
jgi:hypothetical protein